jgi:hypothetical protein
VNGSADVPVVDELAAEATFGGTVVEVVAVDFTVVVVDATVVEVVVVDGTVVVVVVVVDGTVVVVVDTGGVQSSRVLRMPIVCCQGAGPIKASAWSTPQNAG